MINTLETLIVFIFFITPGFLVTTIINRRIKPAESSEIRILISSVIFSIFSHLILSYWTFRIYKLYISNQLFNDNSIINFILWCIVTIIIVPIILGLLLSFLTECDKLQKIFSFFGISKIDRISRSWDYIFLKREYYWIIIHLKSGDKIYGFLGEKSFVSLAHDNPDIFVEEIYNYDEKNRSFGKKISGTKGAWIPLDKIDWISFYRGGEKNE